MGFRSIGLHTPFPVANNNHQVLTIPERVLNWGSNGLSGNPRHFNDHACDQFFYNLHVRIAQANPEISLTPHDLFHAQLIGHGPDGVVC